MAAEEQQGNSRPWLAPHQFKPGQSGNPGGRPKGRSVTARLRDLLDRGEINGVPIKGGKQVADLVSEVILRNALQGDVRFLALLLDRVEGKTVPARPEPEEGDDYVIDLSDPEDDPAFEGDGPPA